MACAAREREEGLYCLACRTLWPADERAGFECKRGGGKGRDVTLSKVERKALNWAEDEWLNKARRGGGYRCRGKIGKIGGDAIDALIALGLCFRAQYGGVRITTYGKAWLDRNTKGRVSQ